MTETNGQDSAPKAATGLQKPIPLSAALAAFMKKTEASSPEVIKALWAHIKAHGCQDPTNKQMIVPDATLSPILGEQPFHMTAISTQLKPHILRPAKAPKAPKS